VGKASRNKNSSDSVKVTTVKNPDQGRSWFLPVVLAIVIAGAVVVGILASQRETNVGIRPEAFVDHWHTAYGIYNCDTFDPPILEDTDPEGIHTHTDGVIHVHPFSASASGRNATLDAFFRATGAQLTDDSFSYGPGSGGERVLSEADGCGGEPATLTLAYWDNALLAEQGAEPDQIITENLADFRFEGDVSAVTLALLPEGAEIPAPPTIPNLQTLTDIG
jgi:hypothetical protein